MTLRENNLKQLQGAKVLDSQGVLVANRQSLLERPGLLEIAHELIERFDVSSFVVRSVQVQVHAVRHCVLDGPGLLEVASLLLSCEVTCLLKGCHLQLPMCRAREAEKRSYTVTQAKIASQQSTE